MFTQKNLLIATAGLLVVGGAAQAANLPLMEMEPNDTIDTANFIDSSNLTNGGLAIDGTLGQNDVDFFSFEFQAGDFVTFSVFDFTPEDGFDNDSFLGIFNPDGSLLDTDDDDGPGFLSSYAFFVPADGIYSFAVTGFGDLDFVGDHEENFDYKVVVGYNPIPGPAAAALFGLAGLAGRRRRRG